MSDTPEQQTPVFPEKYLGDGVYVSFDGYQFWLAANHHRNKVIALEPAVLDSLNVYAKEIAARIRAGEKP